MGGAIATNMSGPRRYGLGTFRDYVIGISVVNDQGQEIKAGGRVVKNVAGYDLCKLYIGSLGTLGIITQMTLKLKPLPEERALVTFGCEAENVDQTLEVLYRSRTRPVCMDLLNQPAFHSWSEGTAGLPPETPWVFAVGFEGNWESVDWQVNELTRELSAGTVVGCEVSTGLASEGLWRGLIELPAWPEARLTFKATLLPSATAAFCRQAAALPENLLLQAHAGNGIIIGHVPGDLITAYPASCSST